MTAAIGGKPPPTVECIHKSKCGRGLAPDEALTNNTSNSICTRALNALPI